MGLRWCRCVGDVRRCSSQSRAASPSSPVTLTSRERATACRLREKGHPSHPPMPAATTLVAAAATATTSSPRPLSARSRVHRSTSSLGIVILVTAVGGPPSPSSLGGLVRNGIPYTAAFPRWRPARPRDRQGNEFHGRRVASSAAVAPPVACPRGLFCAAMSPAAVCVASDHGNISPWASCEATSTGRLALVPWPRGRPCCSPTPPCHRRCRLVRGDVLIPQQCTSGAAAYRPPPTAVRGAMTIVLCTTSTG